MTDTGLASVTELPKFYQPDPIEWQTVQTWLFAPILPWQQESWQYFTQHFPNIPHAILLSGNAGTGKRAFVYRLVAWLLCHHKADNLIVACGHCPSCQWLKSNTHPNLLTIPSIVSGVESENSFSKKGTPAPKKAVKKTALSDTSPNHHSHASIKIDDVRAMTEFVQVRSEGARIVVIHQADAMTLGASNALLKTLEEPAQNVLLFLLSDTPSKLLPTVRSRLQGFNVSQMSAKQSLTFMQQQLANIREYSVQDLTQVNAISGFSPFVAIDMLTSRWYQQRQTWITSWQAIRAKQRTVLQASDYWQKQLSLSDFLFLSRLMLVDSINLSLQLPTNQGDVDWQKLQPVPHRLALYSLQETIDQLEQDRRQNIQEKLCYDKLLGQMAIV